MARVRTPRTTFSTRGGLAALVSTALVGAALLPAASPSAAHDGASHPDEGGTAVSRAEVRRQLVAIRRSHQRYLDPAAAVADGWFPTPECAELPDGSAGMGVHYVNPERLMAPVDAARPPILMYAPRADGTLRLAGVEWMVPDADQDLGTDEDRPTLFGNHFDGPMPGHDPSMPVHYDLHAWIFTPNPDGVFAPFNPLVDC